MIGRTVGHYRILERLGGGGMGVVYRAEDVKLGRMVALKFLPPELTRDADAKSRFLREARAASLLDHNNICTIYDIGDTDDEQTFIAMACYDGETLKARIEQGPLEVDEALKIAEQIARGLAVAHDAGIVHRDIKPANVILTAKGVAKILDFGLAKLAGATHITQSKTTLGTLAYMAPEQLRGETVRPQADLWSLGMLLFELVTGQRPFRGDYDQAVAYSILNEQPASLTELQPDAPAELERIVKKLLRKDPLQRYQTAEELLGELETLRAPSSGSGRTGPRASRPREALRAGARLGPYEIVEPLGSGGMGDVYRARDTRLDRQVAIKVLAPEFSDDAERKQRFQREAKTISSLSHPNICTLFDVGEQEGTDYLVMEYLEGATLADRLTKGALPLNDALKIGILIGEALGAAHRQGVIHRDLKPGNVMLTKSGAVKLVDFGLAKDIGAVTTVERHPRTPDKPLTAEGAIVGTLAYMAPEQVEGCEADARTDIFAFGAILYEMATGRRAFEGATRASLIVAILETEPPLLAETRGVSETSARGLRSLAAIEHIVRRCLERDPDRRSQSALDVANELRWIAERCAVAATSTTARSLPWLAAGAAVLLLAGALVDRLFVRSSPSDPAVPIVKSILEAIGFLSGRDHEPVSFERITFRRGLVTQAHFAPDGQTVIYSAAWDGGPLRIFMKRPDSVDSVAMDLPPADLLSVSRSGELAILIEPQLHVPFGTTIGTLARVSMNGGAPRRMIENVLSADWSPDERSIVLARDTGVDQRLEIRSADGAQLVRQLLVTSSGALGHVRFSPAGDRIAFTVNPNRSSATRLDVAMINADGTGQRTVGRGLNFSNIVWSPDGREIWFAEGIVSQTAVRAASMTGGLRTVFETPGNTSFSDVADGKVLLTQNELAARVSCLARGADAERDASWRTWTSGAEMTADGGQVLLATGLASTKSQIAIGLQPLDGSPIIELARDASLYSFSADERSVLVGRGSPPRELAFVPIGPGETHVLPPMGFDLIAGAAASPNGKTVILAGVTNNIAQLYELPIAGGSPRKISDDPLYFPWLVISPDSSLVAAVGPTRRLTVYRIADGKGTVIESSMPGEFPIRFADDGSLLFTRATALPNPLYRFDFRTQRETLIREFAPADRAGVLWACPNVRSVTADAQSYCYQYAQVLSKLTVAEGLDVTPSGRWSRMGRAIE